MKIGFFTTDFPYKAPFSTTVPGGLQGTIGGVGEVVYHLCQAIAARGHECVIFTTSADSRPSRETVGSISVIRHRKHWRLALSDISFDLIRGPPTGDLDLVHLHLGSPPATLGALNAIRKQPQPFVTTHHLDPDWNAGSLARRALLFYYLHRTIPQVLERSDRIIALSEEFARHSSCLAGFRSKCRVIPNGIDLQEFRRSGTKEECRRRLGFAEDERIVFFLGNLIDRKGPQVLIRAMPLVLAEHPDTRFVLGGSRTPYSQHLEDLARRLGVIPQITFAGRIPDADRAAYYAAADLFALPSFSESFGLVLLEAAASGIPLVVSALPVFGCIVKDGENGLVAKVGSEQDLARALIRLLGDESLRRRMGENARGTAEAFSWPRIAEETERLYRELA